MREHAPANGTITSGMDVYGRLLQSSNAICVYGNDTSLYLNTYHCSCVNQ